MAQKKKTTTTQRKSTSSSKRKSTKQTKTKDANATAKSLKSQRAALQKKLKQSQSQLNRANRDVKQRLSQINEINGQIYAHQLNINRIKLQLDTVNANIAKLESELAKLLAQLKQCKQNYARSMLYMHQNRNTSNKLLFLLSSADFTQMARRYRYAKEYSKYQRVQGELMIRKQREVEQAKAQLTAQRDHHASLLRNEEEENRLLTAKQTEHQTAVDGLKKKQTALKRVIANDQKEINALNKKIEYYVQLAIEQERQRRAEEERKRKEAERKAREEAQRREAELASSKKKSSSRSTKSTAKAAPSESSPDYMPNDKEYKLTSNFAANRGRLPMPITGAYVISTRYGSYTMPGTNVHLKNNGINLMGKSGAQARCIFDGEVTAVFSAGGVQNVMVRHGSYISIYCNLVSVSVRRGQQVTARQTLGRIAADVSGRPNLHFQLRKGATTLNPESWLAR